MPVTPANLRHVLKARHPYIERNLGAVVSIIRHSMQNTVAFEPVAKKLKEEHIEMVQFLNFLYFWLLSFDHFKNPLYRITKEENLR